MENEEQVETVVNEQEEPKTNSKKDRVFTSEELTEIVQRRLSNYKRKASKEIEAEYQVKFSELQERETALMRKELKYEAMDIFKAEDIPTDYLDLLDYDDREKLMDRIDKIRKICETAPKTRKLMGVEPSNPPQSSILSGNKTREAFGL